MLFKRDKQGGPLMDAPSSPLEVKFSFNHAAAFRTALSIVYTGHTEIPPEQIGTLLEFASRYDVKVVQQLCTSQLQVTEKNVWEMFMLGPSIGRPDLALAFIRDNTEAVFKHKDFLNLSSADMLRLLKDDELGYLSEMEILEHTLRWGQVEAKRREMALKDAVQDLLPQIRFPVMSAQEIAIIVSKSLLPEKTLNELFRWVSFDASQRASIPAPSFPVVPRTQQSKLESEIMPARLRQQVTRYIRDCPAWKRVLKGDQSTRIAHFDALNQTRCMMIVNAGIGNDHIFGFHTTVGWQNRTGTRGTPDPGAFLFIADSPQSDLKFYTSNSKHYEPIWGNVGSSWRFGYAFGTNGKFDRWFTKEQNCFGIQPSDLGWISQWNTPEGLTFELFQPA
eukprot:g76171.t1